MRFQGAETKGKKKEGKGTKERRQKVTMKKGKGQLSRQADDPHSLPKTRLHHVRPRLGQTSLPGVVLDHGLVTLRLSRQLVLVARLPVLLDLLAALEVVVALVDRLTVLASVARLGVRTLVLKLGDVLDTLDAVHYSTSPSTGNRLLFEKGQSAECRRYAANPSTVSVRPGRNAHKVITLLLITTNRLSAKRADIVERCSSRDLERAHSALQVLVTDALTRSLKEGDVNRFSVKRAAFLWRKRTPQKEHSSSISAFFFTFFSKALRISSLSAHVRVDGQEELSGT